MSVTRSQARHSAKARIRRGGRQQSPGSRFVWAITRIVLGFVFLWAFLDKLIGFDATVPPAKSWLHGGTPVRDYLLSLHGSFAVLFNALAGQLWAEWVFKIGVAAIGMALILGIGMRIAALTGGILLILLWLSTMPITTGPFLNQHLIYALVIIGLAFSNAGDTLGLGAWWSRRWLVRALPVLR